MISILAVLVLAATPQPAPKNVILLIADGNGPAHYTAAKLVRGADFRIGTMPTIGLVTTHCADHACVMAASHGVEWIDLKSATFCRACGPAVAAALHAASNARASLR